MELLHHSIGVAARKTGLTPHVIRVWEKRHGAVEPLRTGTNRRLYSDAEVERLQLLRQAIAMGYRIGAIARLPADQLRGLVTDGAMATEAPASRGVNGSAAPPDEGQLQAECLEAIRRLDTAGLDAALSRGLVALGNQGLLARVVVPLAGRIGDLWQDGTLSAAHEHFATAVLRTFLTQAGRPFANSDAAPLLVVATPSGQLHELGAVLVASAARNVGWRVVYLGPSLPAAEIAGIALQNHARAVALSIVYPGDDPTLPRELESLRRYLDPAVRILVGGRSARHYESTIRQLGLHHSDTISSLYQVLEEWRGVAA